MLDTFDVAWVPLILILVVPVVVALFGESRKKSAQLATKAERQAARADYQRREAEAESRMREFAAESRRRAAESEAARLEQAKADGRLIEDWSMAERVMAECMRKLGFPDAAVTAGGADGGIDIAASAAAAQVKYQTAKVGRPQVQQLRGAAGDRLPVFFALTSAGYSSSAREWAGANGVALFTYDFAGDLTASSRLAVELLERASFDPPTGAELERAMRPTHTAGSPCECGGVLMIRRNKQTGHAFLGCSEYPKCRFTSPR